MATVGAQFVETFLHRLSNGPKTLKTYRNIRLSSPTHLQENEVQQKVRAKARKVAPF